MIIAVFRIAFLIISCFLLYGCSSLTLPNFESDQEAALFAKGLDHYAETGELLLLRRVPQKYPESEWRPRAETIIELVERYRLQQAALRLDDQELDRCQHEKDVIQRDNQMLEVTLERLKQVLVDLELQTQ